ncbi:hypothetical protein MKW94_024369 [Papaver nudicaule]|uniref:NAD(P)H-quinone oxidoreductase subunit M, chloroplastic n=1 Tax=Papaver nudicaule TaxID=74823 RepID=A0AA41S5P5_PAPNU|nr:hypothetical protein [Papaver nudicaule]
MAATSFSLLGLIGGNGKNVARRRILAAATPQEIQVSEEVQEEKQVEPQLRAQSKSMGREYGGDWLSSVTRHGAPLTEYTLRLIGSDVEHYIRKLLYDGEITYNMNARQLNFSMGKPRVIFNANDESQIQGIMPQ